MLSERFRSARPVKQEPPGHAPEPTATRRPRSGAAVRHPFGPESSAGVQPGGVRPMNADVDRES